MPEGILSGWFGKILQRIFDELIHDPVRLREYLGKFVEGLESLAEKTATVFDDLAVAGLKYSLESDDAWQFVYDKILALYNAIVNGDDTPLDRVALTVEAEKVGLDPTLIVALIVEAIKLIKWWRDNRNS
jgi:hypothetical protein